MEARPSYGSQTAQVPHQSTTMGHQECLSLETVRLGTLVGQREVETGHLTVQAHFMPHDAKALDPARSMNVLVERLGPPAYCTFAAALALLGSPI